jgi:pimeloyl-ACP methyl ester carboxylesterase
MQSAADRELPVYVESNGRRLFGILHTPAGGAADVGVVFLSSGLQNRAGPHRLYVKTARHLTKLGFVCLRLDLLGIGDSEEHALEGNFDCHDPAFASGAIDFMRDEQGVRKLILLGLCAGARAAVKLAGHDQRIDAVVAWSVPMISGFVDMPVSQGAGAYMGPTTARNQLREWASKAINPFAWHRYFSSEKGFREGWRMWRRTLSGLAPEPLRTKSPAMEHFMTSLDAYLSSKRRVLFVYGGQDKIPKTEFAARHPEVHSGQNGAAEYLEVPGSDHTFTRRAASEQVLAETAAWLHRHFLDGGRLQSHAAEARPVAGARLDSGS